MSTRVLITGSNRGIGLEFTRQYLRDDWQVFATCRRPQQAEELQALQEENGDLQVLKLDVTNPDSMSSTYEAIDEEEGLDLLINNAGIYGSDADFESLTSDDLATPFEVNCVGSFRVTQTFLPLLRKAQGNVVFMTSLMGSIEDNRSGGSYPYRISKASLNMLAKTFDQDHRNEGIYTAILHPGWVQTRMGGSNAKISVEKSVNGLRSVISELDADTSGQFLAYDGDPRPW